MLKYENLILGDLFTNCYIVWDEETKKAVVIDPADSGVEISDILQNKQLTLVGILATHGHFDHLLGALDLKLIYQVPFYCSSLDQFLLNHQKETAKHFLKREIKVPNFNKIDIDLNTINEFFLGKEKIEVIKTPGHTPGGVCFYSQKSGLLFSGDTLFVDGIGSTEHRYSNQYDIKTSINRIISLPKETELLPGHGESGTLGIIF